jgi:DNA ligase-1
VNPERYEQDWKFVTYLVFDAPARSEQGMKYEARVAWLEDNIKPQSESTYAAVVGVCKCTGRDHLNKMLKQVLVKGGEGIMLRRAGSLYEKCRSHTLLKVKYFHSEECKVLAHEKGSGRCQNMTGKIRCTLPNGVEFKIGSGFTDAQRRNPPKIGSVVEFKYQEMSDSGAFLHAYCTARIRVTCLDSIRH